MEATDGVDKVAEGVDWPHDEARKTIAMPRMAAIGGEPIERPVVTRVRQR